MKIPFFFGAQGPPFSLGAPSVDCLVFKKKLTCLNIFWCKWNFGKDYWWEISPTRLQRDSVRRNVWDIFGNYNQLTNQPKRFLRKMSGRYVPKVFRAFFSKTSYKKYENRYYQICWRICLNECFGRYLVKYVCGIIFGGHVSKGGFTNSSRRYISQVARAIPGA